MFDPRRVVRCRDARATAYPAPPFRPGAAEFVPPGGWRGAIELTAAEPVAA